mgnify:CR=1 FL=1
MRGNSDFVIENGVLKEYTGSGGDVVIPEGVTEIGAGVFISYRANRLVANTNVKTVTVPLGVEITPSNTPRSTTSPSRPCESGSAEGKVCRGNVRGQQVAHADEIRQRCNDALS